jgi:hypothetical protein
MISVQKDGRRHYLIGDTYPILEQLKASTKPAEYMIEYLDGSGFWRPIEESTTRTGCTMAPITYHTYLLAQGAIARMSELSSWRGLRITELRLNEDG